MRKNIALAMTILLLGNGAAYAAAPSPASAPGTRVVPVIRNVPNSQPTSQAKAVKATASTEGKAAISRYVTPEFERTLGTDAALAWVFGVLGGNREYLYAAPDIFKTAGSPSQDKVTGFLTLREQLYPATAWSIGNGQLMGVDKEFFGYKVKVLSVNLDSLKETSFKQVSQKYPKLSEDARRVLAEWHVMYKLRDENVIKKLRHTQIERVAPVNLYGKIAFGSESVKELVETPEKLIIEIAKAFDETPKWAVPYMDSIKFIVSYSANAYFSPELKAVLK